MIFLFAAIIPPANTNKNSQVSFKLHLINIARACARIQIIKTLTLESFTFRQLFFKYYAFLIFTAQVKNYAIKKQKSNQIGH